MSRSQKEKYKMRSPHDIFSEIMLTKNKKNGMYRQQNFQELKKNVEKAIDKVKPENYKNYFEYAYGTSKKTEYTRKPSTRKHKLKLYKDI